MDYTDRKDFMDYAEYRRIVTRPDSMKKWLRKTCFFLIIVMVLFGIGLLAGFLIELPQRIFGPDPNIGHQIVDLIAALVFVVGI